MEIFFGLAAHAGLVIGSVWIAQRCKRTVSRVMMRGLAFVLFVALAAFLISAASELFYDTKVCVSYFPSGVLDCPSEIRWSFGFQFVSAVQVSGFFTILALIFFAPVAIVSTIVAEAIELAKD